MIKLALTDTEARWLLDVLYFDILQGSERCALEIKDEERVHARAIIDRLPDFDDAQ